MNSDMIEILKAKRDALEALELALAKQVDAGHIAGADGALRFVKTWSQAVDAMVPLEDAPVSRSLHPAGDPGAVHYGESEDWATPCGVDLMKSPMLTRNGSEVTCEDCVKALS